MPVRLHRRGDAPIFLRAEQLDLALAIDDQAQRHRLDPAGRLGAGQLAPQHRRQGEADQIIERAAGPIGVDQILVERARIRHRLGHRRLGDRVEGDPLDMGGQRLASSRSTSWTCQLIASPSRSGSVARISGVGLLRLVGDRLQLPRLVGIGLPLHREAVVGIDRAVLGRQIADMAVGGEHAIAAAQIFLDGLGLGGRFDDDELHEMD